MEEVALVRLSDDVRREVCLEFGVFLGDPASCGTHDLGWSGLVEEGERGVVCWEEAEPTDAEQRRTGRGCNANRSLISVFVLLEGPFGSDSRLCVVKRQEEERTSFVSFDAIHSPRAGLQTGRLASYDSMRSRKAVCSRFLLAAHSLLSVRSADVTSCGALSGQHSC